MRSSWGLALALVLVLTAFVFTLSPVLVSANDDPAVNCNKPKQTCKTPTPIPTDPPPTEVPPTEVPPTVVPPTAVPPTQTPFVESTPPVVRVTPTVVVRSTRVRDPQPTPVDPGVVTPTVETVVDPGPTPEFLPVTGGLADSWPLVLLAIGGLLLVGGLGLSLSKRR